MNQSFRLFVVDDEHAQLEALCALLEQEGFSVTGFANPQDALLAIQSTGCDLLLTDLRLPGMNGTALIQQAKKSDPDLPAILMTGHGSVNTAIEALHLGAIDYVLKPFKLSVMLPVIRRALENKVLKKQNANLLESVTRANQQLTALNSDLDTFAARVAHDLNSVMHLIQGHATSLTSRSSSSLDEQERRHIQRIKETSSRGSQLVSDLLAFARLGNTQINFKPVKLKDVVGRAKILTELDSDGPLPDWQIDALPEVQGDESLLEQVFVNLFSNALKFSSKREHPSVEVRHSETEDQHFVLIKDNGVGFDAEMAGDLFKPFHRLHTTHDFQGHGMGLANVKKIIESHHGKIEAKSVPGESATFIIQLPKRPQSSVEGQPAELARPTKLQTSLHTLNMNSDELSDHQQALQALKFSLALQRMGGQLGKMGSWCIDLQANNTVYWSEETFRLLDVDSGIPPDLERGMDRYVGESRTTLATAVEACSIHGTPFDITAEVRTFKGRLIWARVLGEAIRDSHGKPVLIHGCFQDVTEKQETDLMMRRMNRLLLAQNQVTVTLNQLDSPQAMFEEICRVASTIGGVPLIWIVQVDAQKQALQVMGKAGEHTDLVSIVMDNLAVDLDDHLITPLRAGHLYVCNDVSQEALAIKWHQEASARGLESFAVIPLHVNGKLNAALINFGRGKNYFSEEMVVLMQSVAKHRSLALERLVNDIERHQTMESLKLLQTCVARLNDMVIITDAQAVNEQGPRILYVNDAFVHHTGYSHDEVIGQSPRILKGPQTQQNALERIRHALDHCEPVQEELINYTKHGKPIWVELETVPIVNTEGKHTHWIAIQRNITERKRNEAALEESLQKFRSLTKVTSDCIWDWDLNTNSLWWSDGLQSIFGHPLPTRESTIVSWTTRIHPQDLDRVQRKIKDALQDSAVEMWQDEYRFAHIDGRWLDVIDRGCFMRDKHGKAVRMVGGITNMSHIVQAKRQSQTQLEQMRLLHQITRAIGKRHDMDSIYQVVTNHVEKQLPADFCLMASYDAKTNTLCPRSVGENSKDLAKKLGIDVDATVPGVGIHLEDALRGNSVHNANLGIMRGPIGAAMHAVGGLHSLVITPLMKDNLVLGIAVIARKGIDAFTDDEITFLNQLGEHVALALAQTELLSELQNAYRDLKNTQELVLQQERLQALAEMASGLAHDINNAISPAALYAESLIANEPTLSERGSKHLQIIQTAIDDVAHTVARISRFSRQEDEAEIVQSGEVNRACMESIELTKVKWNSIALKNGINIQMRTSFQPDLPVVAMSESEMREIVTNLILNAIDAMPTGGEISIGTSFLNTSHNAQVVIDVKDTGIGMNDEQRARCYEPFFTTKGERGTGLGLAMVYGIVKRANGQMEVFSNPGEGTQIQIKLPAKKLLPEDSNLDQKTQVTGVASPLKLLLVDDDSNVLSAMNDILSANGHHVEFARNGAQAIEIFVAENQKQLAFDAVITDLGMPGIDGRELSTLIKTMRPGTPVIMLTGWGKQMSFTKEELPNVDILLSKPPKTDELEHALNVLCKK
ncbi:ATP-binding protein [Limnobacter parvus]|uniref:histidine kinase n=1 Tax=Limnobacter parvus TaxID=2939690 RepID=A0ABT1XEA6_9BURK|nr:ATP-binding protein [Limnobacter parvus]MCR2745484.1 response regulator [Limnobacter parvus]